MNPLLARVLAIDSPHNKVFLDYLMFNFDKYLADPSGSRTILMILKRTQYQKFIDHCIHFIEKRILEPSQNNHAAANLMTQLFDLNLKYERIQTLINMAFENATLIFTKSKILFKPFVKLAILLPDDHLLSLFEILKGEMLDFISCKSRNYLVQEYINRKTLPSFVVKHIQKLTLENLPILLP